MKKSLYLSALGAALSAALALGTASADDHVNANVDTNRVITAHDHESGFHPLRGTVNAFRASGSAIEYGAREFGQTVSGRQGRPESELHSARERARMRQHAMDARRDFGGEGGEARTHVQLNSNLSSRGRAADHRARESVGGGPVDHTNVQNREYRSSSVRSYRDNVGGGPSAGATVRTDNTGVKGDVDVNNNHDNINGTREFREGGRSLVHGTGDAIRAGGNGVAYGAREVGQSISGRQGNPRGEAASARERQRMHQEAGQSRQEMHDLGTHTRNVGEDITH